MFELRDIFTIQKRGFNYHLFISKMDPFIVGNDTKVLRMDMESFMIQVELCTKAILSKINKKEKET